MIPEPTTHSQHRQQGFTLVELAVVLVIIGMLISLGSGLVGPLTKQAKIKESKEAVNVAIESVTGFAASNSRLPNQYTEFVTATKKPEDAWGTPLTYFFEPLLSVPSSICGRRSTTFTICRTLACAATERISNVAFAVVSGGENYNPQSGIRPCPGGVPGTCLTGYDPYPDFNGDGSPDTNLDNCTTTVNCPATNVSATFVRTIRPEAYDDIIKWVTLDELRMKSGCSGPQLKLLTNDLPAGQQGTAYPLTGGTLSLRAEGGVPFTAGGGRYRWCIQKTPALPLAPTPAELTFAPANLFNANCNTAPGARPEAQWPQADQVDISGIPATPGLHTFTVFVRDDNNATGTNDNITSRQYSLAIGNQFRVINPELPQATQGTTYSANIQAEGGGGATTGYRWCVERTAIAGVPTFPPGLAFTPNTVRNPGGCTLAPNNWGAASAQLQLTGTPTIPGLYAFTAFVRDTTANAANNNIASKQFALTVNGPTMRIVNNDLPTPAKVGVQYAPGATPFQIIADGGVPFTAGVGGYRWCIQKIPAAPVNPTPAGLTFAPANLFNANCLNRAENNWPQAQQIAISGTPNTAGVFNFIIFARDNKNPAGTTDTLIQKSFSLTVNP